MELKEGVVLNTVCAIGHFIRPNPSLIRHYHNFAGSLSISTRLLKLELSGQREKKKVGKWPVVSSNIYCTLIESS